MTNHICTDPINGITGQHLTDNGWYVGHDEPSLQFFSNAAGSANNVQYSLTLPTADPTPTQSGSQTANFENYIAYWFSLALCDPTSFPQGPCTADSDTNSPSMLTGSGSALLELQFYPPGWQPFINQISCDHTHWCAALNIDSLECTAGFTNCNNGCEEPVNFAFVQTNGIPTGPPGPGAQTGATFTPNANTMLMNPGDNLAVSIVDTPSGLQTTVNDVTTAQSGFMIASAGNGFMDAVPGTASGSTCTSSNFHTFTFHPEYSSAKPGNIVPWAALFPNVNFAMEIGHFELNAPTGANGDGDSGFNTDDTTCFAGPNNTPSATSVGGCISSQSGGELDYDGTSYAADWADGSPAHPGSFVLGEPHSAGSPYASFLFATDGPASELTSFGSGTTCNASTGTGCVLPPKNHAGQSVYYPFFSTNAACNWLFGNDISGQTTNDFGKVAQYGSANPSFKGTFTSAILSIPTCGSLPGVPQFPTTSLMAAALALLGVAFLTRGRRGPLLRAP
ncbi:MAG: hypothetical protein OK455_07105 [Thaumarchaeota archaeon]|nr:hypothetical protein [Nitrososphaerota archaeon]